MAFVAATALSSSFFTPTLTCHPTTRFRTRSPPPSFRLHTRALAEAQMSSQSSNPSFKRICVFSDGSWNTPELESPTNVSLLARSVKHDAPDNVQQIVFYDQGVGTEGDAIDKVLGGAMGKGIDLNIQQLYTFLVLNYDVGDEIYMFGFSRGSYTIRSLAGMIDKAGLLKPEKLSWVQEAYALYRKNKDADGPVCTDFRAKHARVVPITLLACFDTVGALGIPDYVPFPFSLLKNRGQYKFHDTTISEHVQNAVHVVSIDEELVPFQPTLMSASERRDEKQVTQIFMAGRHGGVGGGSAENEPLARNALKFLVEEMKNRHLNLALDESVVPTEFVTDYQPAGRPGRVSLFGIIGLTMGYKHRDIPEGSVLHPTVAQMYKTLPDWRPDSLKHLEKELLDGSAKIDSEM